MKSEEHPYARVLRHLGSAIRSPRSWLDYLSRRARSRVTDARNEIADRLYARAAEIDAGKATTARTEPEAS